MNNETSYFYCRLSVSKKYFYVSLCINFFTVLWRPPSCGGPEQLPSLPSLKSGPNTGRADRPWTLLSYLDTRVHGPWTRAACVPTLSDVYHCNIGLHLALNRNSWLESAFLLYLIHSVVQRVFNEHFVRLHNKYILLCDVSGGDCMLCWLVYFLHYH